MDVERMVREAQGPALRFLARTVGAGQAQDLAQETFARAVRAIEGGVEPETLTPWLLGIARNVVLEWLRSGRYERALQERLATGVEYGLVGAGFHDAVAERLVVAQALDDLPRELREPVTLHYFAGLRTGEVARQLGISAGAVKTRLWRARQILRSPLASLVEREELVTTFEHVEVMLDVGGVRGATDPLGPPLLPVGGLSATALAEAIDRIHLVRDAGEVPLCRTLYLWPMFDAFEHPEPAAVWRTCRAGDIAQEAWNAQHDSGLVPSDGWRIGTDPDAGALLDEFQSAGLRRVHFTLLGIGATHDALTARPGSFEAIVRAMDLCADRGIDVSANVIVTQSNTADVDETVRLVRDHGGGYVAVYTPLHTHEVHETARPSLDDLRGLHPDRWMRPADEKRGIPYAEFWADPAAFAEGELTRRALDDTTSETAPYHGPPRDPEAPPLYLDSELDLHAGNISALPSLRLGNLRHDRPESLHQAITSLTPPQIPPDRDLARRHGDTTGRGLYMNRSSLRTKWLRAWRHDNNVPWLP